MSENDAPTSELSDRALADLARDLPADVPDDARREAVRTSLLAAATAERDVPRPRWRLVATGFAAGALAAAAIAVIVVRAHPSAPAVASHDVGSREVASREVTMPLAAHIDAPSDASFERELVHDGSGHVGELVRVHAGTLHVASTQPGQRVQLATADARVDGDGEVDVEVAGDRLRAVTVRSGTATLRVRDQQVVVLAAGQTWKAPVITAQVEVTRPAQVEVTRPAQVEVTRPAQVEVPPPAPAHVESPARLPRVVDKPAPEQPAAVAQPTVEPPVTAQPLASQPLPVEEPALEKPAGSARTPSPTEQHFAAGWTLLKQGNAAAAARELGLAADSDGDAALAADARYFQAVALIRAGRKTEAEKALVGFLDKAPHSIRRGRAAVMLAKLIAERGDAKSARAWFESALSDADPAVVAAARAGIAAL